MKRLRALGPALLAILSGIVSAAEAPLPAKFEIESAGSGATYDFNTGMATITNGVTVRYGDAVLSADTVRLNQDTGDVRAEGGVILNRGAQQWRGEALFYNFKTRQMGAAAFRFGAPPMFGEAHGLAGDATNRTYTALRPVLTTDDVEHPGFTITARSITIVPDEYVELRHATLRLQGVPVFYWAYYKRSLKRHPFNVELTPGYRSLYGAYALGTYNAWFSSNLIGEFHLDYRAKRGVGYGPSVQYNLGAAGAGELHYYYTHDDEPGTNVFSGQPIDPERQRFRLRHDVTLASNFFGKAVINYQSDPQFIRDFFETEYRQDLQPASFVEATRFWPNHSLSLLAQPRVNHFFESVERLPDVKLSAARQQIGTLPLYYEGESSLGYFRYETNGLPRYSAWRADTLHQVLAPRTFFGWLNVTPRAAGRFTHYSESESALAETAAADRWVFNAGAEVSFKASRIWPAATNAAFEIDGLRHIVEPLLNYSYVPTPNKRPYELPQFDTMYPSLRPLPIDFPRFNDIDSIDRGNTLRLGLRNKVQTRREGGIENVIDWDAFVDWRLDPAPDEPNFGDFISVLDLRPRSWLTLNSEVRVGIDDRLLREANHELFLQPADWWSLGLGHRYFREDPQFGADSAHNLLTTSLYLRFNENWGVRLSHRYEASDGRLEEQWYTIYRDLRSWTSALTFRVRDGNDGRNDVTVALMLSLKAFPRGHLGDDRNHPTSLLGY